MGCGSGFIGMLCGYCGRRGHSLSVVTWTCFDLRIDQLMDGPRPETSSITSFPYLDTELEIEADKAFS